MTIIMKKFIYNAALCMALTATFVACEEQSDEVTEFVYNRTFSPMDVKAQVINRVQLRLAWNQLKDADSYVIELANDTITAEEATPAGAIVETATSSPFIKRYNGDTKYYGRIKAVRNGKGDSKYVTFTFKTDEEQIVLAGNDAVDVAATSVKITWPAGEEVTSIVYKQNGEEVVYTLSAEEIAAGEATVTGLTGETSYKFKLMNGSVVRGSKEATTLMDFGDATPVYAGDNFKSMLDDAEDGAEFILVDEAEFKIGSYALTKSVTISGLKPAARPTLNGAFTLGTDEVSLKLKSVIMNGSYEDTDDSGATTNVLKGHPFDCTANAATIASIELEDCLFQNYQKGFIYNNKKANVGSIIINNCVIKDIEGDGGDFIDFRGGSLENCTVTNSTFMNGGRAFLRVQVAAAISFKNCTFYRMCIFDNSNNSGIVRMKDGGSISFENCLFDKIGDGVAFGLWAKAGNITAEESYKNNYYNSCANLWEGFYTVPADGFSAADPQPADAANGDLTITNLDFPANVGDPRWYRK